MSKLNKLVTNYPVSLSTEEVENLSATLAPVVAACGGGGGGGTPIYYYGDDVNINISPSRVIRLTDAATAKLNRDIPTKVSDLTDSANYQTTAGMDEYLTTANAQTTYLTKSSAAVNLAPISVTGEVNTLKTASAGWDKVSDKLDTTAFSTVSGNFLTEVPDTYALKSDIPTTVAQLTDSGNYYKKTDTSSKSELSTEFAKYQPTGNYLVADDITGKLDKSIYANASGNWENTYNVVKQYSAAGTWLTAHQSLTNYYTKSETSGAGELSTEFAKYVTSSNVSTPDSDYVMTTTGWKVLTLTGGGMTQVIHDDTLTGQGNANDNKLGVAWSALSGNTIYSANKAASASAAKRLQDSTTGPSIQVGDVTALQNWASSNSSTWDSVTAKLGTAQYANDSATFVTKPDTTQTVLNNNYLIYSTLTDPTATTGWMPLSANYYSKTEADGRYQKKEDMSSYLTTAKYETDSATFVTSSSNTITGTKQYALTTAGWAVVSTPTIPDITANNGISANGHTIGIDNTNLVANTKYAWTTTGWSDIGLSNYLPLSGGTVTGDVIVKSTGNNLLAVNTTATLMGQSRVANLTDTTAIGTNWLGVNSNGGGFLKNVQGGNVGALNGTSIQIDFAPNGNTAYGNITVNSQGNESKVVHVPTASYNSMSSFDNTNGPNYMLRKTASGFDIGAAVINVTSLPATTEANTYYFVYDV